MLELAIEKISFEGFIFSHTLSKEGSQQGYAGSEMLFMNTTSGYGLFDSNSSNETMLSMGQEKEPKWALLGLCIVPLWILIGNMLVLLAVFLNKNLRTLSNWVVASLAATDFLLAVLVVPLGVYNVINGRWNLGFIPCLIWTGSDVFLSTASILHLVAIAIHRYLGISHPLHFRNNADKRQILALLLPAWLVSLVITLPLIIQGIHDNTNVLIETPEDGPQCGIFDRMFAIYSSTVSFFVPLGIMIFADIGSVYALRQTSKVTHTNHFMRRSKSQSVSITYRRGHSGYRLAISDPVSDTKVRHHLMDYSGRPIRTDSESGFLPGVNISGSETSSLNGELAQKSQKQRFSKFMGTARFLSMRGPIKPNSRERRAERTLIWVFVCFIALWLPFFCTNLSYGCCPSCDIPSYVFLTFTWLGYISSGVNPCIYTFLNKDFRNAFKRILFCKHNKDSKNRPVASFS